MMHPGIVGALALIGTAGAIYFGSGYLNDYFAARNAETAVESAAQNEEAAGTPSSLVGDAGEAPAEGEETEAADASDGDTMAVAVEEVAIVANDVAEAADDIASTVQETAEETLERVLQAAPREQSETGAQDSTAEPGTAPILDIVRIEPTGEAVIAGNAPQGERVGLLYNNELIADSVVDAGGDFVLIPDQPIPSGEGTMEIVVIDDAGNTVTPSQEQVAVVLPEDGSTDGFLVGVLRPNEPVDIIERQAPDADAGTEAEVEVAALVEPATSIEAPSSETAETASPTDVAQETTPAPEVEIAARVEPTQPVETEQAAAADAFVVVDAIELEGDDMWIAGGALPGTVIRLYQDNIFLGEVVTGEEGRFLYEGTLLDSDGDVSVRADALVTGSADVIARAEVPFEVPLSSAQIAAAALDQVEDAVTAIEETTTEIAAAATEQVEETVAEVAQTTQEQVADSLEAVTLDADTLETASDASADIAETVQEQATTAVEAASEVANAVDDAGAEAPADTVVATATDAVAETAVEAAEIVQETVAAAVETTAAAADATSAQIADTAETAVETVVETAVAIGEVVAPAAGDAAPQVEIATTTVPTTNTPPTEALAQALEEAAAEATSEVEREMPADEIAASTTPSTAPSPATSTQADVTPTPVAPATEVAATEASQAPASAPAAAPAAAPPAQPERISVLDTGQVIIRRGDNLWRLSRRVYGQGIRYTSIYDANRDQIGQPELIFPGQVFTLPTPQEEWGAVPGLEALEADQIPVSGAQTQ